MRIGVILSGCGVNDGSEIHEAVLTLLAIDKAGAQAVIMAPDMEQADVVDHFACKPAAEKRNVLVESARIARGNIRNLRDVKPADFDALVLPGGFGAAKNLSTYAKDGQNCSVRPDVAELVSKAHKAGKPVGALCIAPAVLAKVLGSEGPKLTIGSDPGTAKALEAMGAVHAACAADDVVVDAKHRIATTPAYMLAKRISEVASGAEKLVKALVKMAAAPAAR